ncbi:uncharacterized protein LOC129582178 [Paramacrobiotus metropolitanus]|uniref:uncharacterized protein LOC129582178 n=1 Tax=Paramacrobiotus metropolitanus TaxID=2943436 RepID=UPI0024459321|nr:uncharacterized protein LOC129582178 [Paramacrobiotus metropolitanus]
MESTANAPSSAVAPRVAPFQIAVNGDSEAHSIGRAWRLCKIAKQYGNGVLDVVHGRTRELLKKPDVNETLRYVGNDVILPVKGCRRRCPAFPGRYWKSFSCRPLSDDAKICRDRAIFIAPYIGWMILHAALATWIFLMITTACHEDGSGSLSFNNATVAIPKEYFSVEQWIGAANNDSARYDWNAVSVNDTKDTALRKLCFTIHCGLDLDSDTVRYICTCPRSKVKGWLWGTSAYANAVWGLWMVLAQVVGMIGMFGMLGFLKISFCSRRCDGCVLVLPVILFTLLYGCGLLDSLVNFFYVVAAVARVAPIFYGLLS